MASTAASGTADVSLHALPASGHAIDVGAADFNEEPIVRGVSGTPNIHIAERVVTGAAGAALTVYALLRYRTRTPAGAAMAAAGAYLVYRSITGHCPAYAALRTGTARQSPDNENTVIPHGQGIRIEEAVTVEKPAAELYRFWRDLENLPRIMAHLESVTTRNADRSHWVAKAPLGRTVEWDARIINEVENERIAWRSEANADIPNAGSVRFIPRGDGRGTEVRVNLEYNPPAGVLGAAVAKLFGEEPGAQVRDDLRHFKSLMESGDS